MAWLADRIHKLRWFGRRHSPRNLAGSHQVILYTRKACPLCEEAVQALRAHGLSPELVDVDASVDLQARYGTCVPVVQIDGKIRFRGRVNPVLLRRLLRGGSQGERASAEPS